MCDWLFRCFSCFCPAVGCEARSADQAQRKAGTGGCEPGSGGCEGMAQNPPYERDNGEDRYPNRLLTLALVSLPLSFWKCVNCICCVSTFCVLHVCSLCNPVYYMSCPCIQRCLRARNILLRERQTWLFFFSYNIFVFCCLMLHIFFVGYFCKVSLCLCLPDWS